MFSLTQGGNYGQLISMLIIMTGYAGGDPEAANEVFVSAQVVIGFLTYIISFLASWLGRFRKGDITPLGFRKY